MECRDSCYIVHRRGSADYGGPSSRRLSTYTRDFDTNIRRSSLCSLNSEQNVFRRSRSNNSIAMTHVPENITRMPAGPDGTRGFFGRSARISTSVEPIHWTILKDSLLTIKLKIQRVYRAQYRSIDLEYRIIQSRTNRVNVQWLQWPTKADQNLVFQLSNGDYFYNNFVVLYRRIIEQTTLRAFSYSFVKKLKINNFISYFSCSVIRFQTIIFVRCFWDFFRYETTRNIRFYFIWIHFIQK